MIDSQTGAFTSIGGVAIDNSFAYKVSVDPLDRFVYVAYFQEDGPHLVIPLTLDSNSGTLSRVAAPVAVDQGDWLVPDPSGRFLYVGNSGSNTISAFKVDPTSGALTPIAGAPFATTGAATQLDAAPGAIDPSGKYLYVTSSVASNVSVYAIDHNSGRLRPSTARRFQQERRLLQFSPSLWGASFTCPAIPESRLSKSTVPTGHSLPSADRHLRPHLRGT